MKSRRAVRRPSLAIAACLAALVGGLGSARSEDAGGPGPRTKPNVLFIVVDDLAPQLGCYGVEAALTPSIDALAARGVVFEQAHCQYPLCAPSRASFLTGRYPASLGVTTQAPLEFFRDLAPDAVTLPQLFRRAGWITARAGKVFHNKDEDPASWSIGGRAPNPTGRSPEAMRKHFERSDDWGPVDPSRPEVRRDVDTADRAIELLEEHAGTSFFLGVGFFRPHAPLLAPRRFFERGGTAPRLPSDFMPKPTPPEGAGPWAFGPNTDIFRDRSATRAEARDALLAYHACVAFIDEQIGRILAALDRLALRERTIVTLLGDHGFHLGERGKWGKYGSLYDSATRVPLILDVPGRDPARCARLVELVDVFPTLAELAGLASPPEVDGNSLIPLLDEPTRPWPHPALTFSRSGAFVGTAVRTERHRYIAWEGPRRHEELYDLEADPRQSRSVVGDPDQAAALEELRDLLAGVPRPAPLAPPGSGRSIQRWALFGCAALLAAALLIRMRRRGPRASSEDDLG